MNGKKKFSKKENTNSKPMEKSENSKSRIRYDKKCATNNTEQRGYIRDNDPSWYTSYPGIFGAASNISFNQPVGLALNLTDANDQAFNALSTAVKVPNVMSFAIALTPGVSNSAASIINTAMFQNYNFVRHANSGSKNYDAVDLQMYYLAVDEALCALWLGIRNYGTLKAFNALNRAIPRVLFDAYGFDYDSWTDNPAQVRARLNLLATKMASLCVPDTLALNKRHQSLFQNVFSDGDNIKSQMYVFTLHGVRRWGRVSQVGKLTYTPLNASESTRMTVDQYFDFMDGLLQPLLEDEDINIMSGDVLKAYGSEGLLTIPMIGEDYVTPVYSSKDTPYMMTQIENARCLTLPFYNANMDISQSANGHLVFAPEADIPATNADVIVASTANLLNARVANVTTDDIVELTRLHPVYSSRYSEDGSRVIVSLRSCGTELPLKCKIHTYSNGSLETSDAYQFVNVLSQVPLAYFNFDWAPLVYLGATIQAGDKYNVGINGIIGDLSNYTTVSKVNMDLIHDSCVASELLIQAPKVSKY